MPPEQRNKGTPVKNLFWVVLGAVITLPGNSLISIAYAQQERPVCQYADSDPDGDGFGWENRTSCRVTVASVEESPTTCIDDDGDGWGWDGIAVCRVEAANCVDTDPIGDGWGWDGATSCRVTAYLAPFSELAELRSNNRTLDGRSLAAATVTCPLEGGSASVIDLFENGEAHYWPDWPESSSRDGTWSTGFSDSDGILNIYTRVFDSTIRNRLLMQPGSITLLSSTGQVISDTCRWAI